MSQQYAFEVFIIMRSFSSRKSETSRRIGLLGYERPDQSFEQMPIIHKILDHLIYEATVSFG